MYHPSRRNFSQHYGKRSMNTSVLIPTLQQIYTESPKFKHSKSNDLRDSIYIYIIKLKRLILMDWAFYRFLNVSNYFFNSGCLSGQHTIWTAYCLDELVTCPYNFRRGTDFEVLALIGLASTWSNIPSSCSLSSKLPPSACLWYRIRSFSTTATNSSV